MAMSHATRRYCLFAILLLIPLLAACRKSAADQAYGGWIELQIGTAPDTAAAITGDKTVHVVRTHWLPVPIEKSRAGHVVSMVDGSRVEFRWSSVIRRMNGLAFKDFRWKIGNRLIEESGSRTFGWNGPLDPPYQDFGKDYHLLVTPVSVSADHKNGPYLMIRARLSNAAPPAPDIELMPKALNK